eukprot:SAG31_NODE_1776_length_7300_cov_10.281905_1_plen_211_part_00
MYLDRTRAPRIACTARAMNSHQAVQPSAKMHRWVAVAALRACLALGAAAAAADVATSPDWKARRSELVQFLFGGDDGLLPSRRHPDLIESVPGLQAEGCLCAARGRCNASECRWSNNMTKLTWTLESRLTNHSDALGVYNNATGSYIRLNSTVYHTLNTSASAPAYHGWSAQMPQPSISPKKLGSTLVLFHQGHDVPHNVCTMLPLLRPF